jgi:lipoyl synthase
MRHDNNNLPKPDWLKKKIDLKDLHKMKTQLRHLKLHTVCESASCPNAGECFAKGVATIMIMGDVCTRSCKFCNVKTGRPGPLDTKEPENVAAFVKEKNLKYVVITSVDRDDLKEDYGAGHYATVVKRVNEVNPNTQIEVLTPDFMGKTDCLDKICQEDIAVFNHNLETVEPLTPQIRSVAKYDRSLQVLDYVAKEYPHILTKSGLMLGLGESKDAVVKTMQDLINVKCKILTLGQYLAPSKEHWPVKEYVHPDQFNEYEKLGLEMGFKAVFAGPFVRSSYMAGDVLSLVSGR